MALLTNEQIREIEQREYEKQLQRELEEQRLREVEMKRKEEEQKAKELHYKQLRVAHEPLVSMVESLKENNYLVLQYQNPNGNIGTYYFKSPDATRYGEFWIGINNEYEFFVTNGSNSRQMLFQNILGYEVKEEIIAEVVMIGGVPYKRMILEPDKIEMNIIDKTTMSYKGEYR